MLLLSIDVFIRMMLWCLTGCCACCIYGNFVESPFSHELIQNLIQYTTEGAKRPFGQIIDSKFKILIQPGNENNFSDKVYNVDIDDWSSQTERWLMYWWTTHSISYGSNKSLLEVSKFTFISIFCYTIKLCSFECRIEQPNSVQRMDVPSQIEHNSSTYLYCHHSKHTCSFKFKLIICFFYSLKSIETIKTDRDAALIAENIIYLFLLIVWTIVFLHIAQLLITKYIKQILQWSEC